MPGHRLCLATDCAVSMRVDTTHRMSIDTSEARSAGEPRGLPLPRERRVSFCAASPRSARPLLFSTDPFRMTPHHGQPWLDRPATGSWLSPERDPNGAIRRCFATSQLGVNGLAPPRHLLSTGSSPETPAKVDKNNSRWLVSLPPVPEISGVMALGCTQRGNTGARRSRRDTRTCRPRCCSSCCGRRRT